MSSERSSKGKRKSRLHRWERTTTRTFVPFVPSVTTPLVCKWCKAKRYYIQRSPGVYEQVIEVPGAETRVGNRVKVPPCTRR